MALIEMLQLWAEKGKKYPKDIPFKLYISDVGLENTFVLIKQLEKSMCLVKLYTVNSLIVTDKTFCIEMESWLRNIAQQSTLVSESSAIDRFNFFSAQRKKITDFMVSCFNGNH
jgi:predicted transcriptional regulator